MLNQVRRGDKVITAGGIISTITKVINDDEVQVEIADGVKVKIARATLASVQSKTEPVKESAKKPEVANDEGEKKGGGLLGRLTNKD